MGFVVAISGTSGAGKSSLMHAIAARYSSVALMHFDHYIVLGTDGGDIQGWLDAGADPNLIETPQLVMDLEALKAGRPVIPPGGGQVDPAPLILLEEPFGRYRSAITSQIDLSVHLELPHDIALARRSLRSVRAVADGAGHHEHVHALADLMGQFAAYLGPGREAYQLAEVFAREVADRVLDAMRPVDELAGDSIALMVERNGPVPDDGSTPDEQGTEEPG